MAECFQDAFFPTKSYNVETRNNEKQKYEDPNLTFVFTYEKDVNLANLIRIYFFPSQLYFHITQN